LVLRARGLGIMRPSIKKRLALPFLESGLQFVQWDGRLPSPLFN
jgi:hypothetical protein